MPQMDFELGGGNLRILSPLSEVISTLKAVYSVSNDRPLAQIDTVYEVFRKGTPEGSKIFVVEENGRINFLNRSLDSVIRHICFIISEAIIQRTSGHISFHAGSVSYEGVGIMLPGESHSGKSTLTLALLLRGCQYFSDEIAMVARGSLRLFPSGKNISLRSDVFGLFPQFQWYLSQRTFQQPWQEEGDETAFLPPQILREEVVSTPSPVRLIVFPSFIPGHPLQCKPLDRSKAVLELLRYCFKLEGTVGNGIDLIIEMVRKADCYTLTFGDLEQATERIIHVAQLCAVNDWDSKSQCTRGLRVSDPSDPSIWSPSLI